MTLHEELDRAADVAMAGRRVAALDIRRLQAQHRRRSVQRVLVAAAACLALLVPAALVLAGGWPPAGRAQPAGREGSFVVPTRIADLTGARPLLDTAGEVTAPRLSMAFLGTLRGQLTPVGLDASTGRPVLLPELGADLPGLDAGAVADVSQSAVPVLVALSPDGRTVVVSYQNAWDAWDLVFDLSSARAALVHQKAPPRADGAALLTVAALDGGRYALPSDDLSGVRLGQVGGRERTVVLPGLDANAGLVVQAGPVGSALVTAQRAVGWRQWMWQVDVGTGEVREVPASPVTGSGWAGAAVDVQGRLVSLVDGTRLVAHDLGDDASTDVGRVVLSGVPGIETRDLRVVAAGEGRVVLTDDGRQRTARFVAGAEPHHLLAVTPSGEARTLTTFALPRSDSGPATSSLAVASSVVATAQATTVDAGGTGWWAWWLLLVVPLALGGAALWLRTARSAATDLPWQHSGPPAH